jgi:hypothetical protein
MVNSMYKMLSRKTLLQARRGGRHINSPQHKLWVEITKTTQAREAGDINVVPTSVFGAICKHIPPLKGLWRLFPLTPSLRWGYIYDARLGRA